MKLTEQLNSSAQVDVLEAAIRSLPGGADALNAAIDDHLAPKPAP